MRTREQGLCYYCDDKLTPGHKCKPKQLYRLNGEGEESESFEALIEKEEGEDHEAGV